MKRRFLLAAAPALAAPVAVPVAPVVEAHADDFTIKPIESFGKCTRAPNAPYSVGAHVIIDGSWWVVLMAGVTGVPGTPPYHDLQRDVLYDGTVIWKRYV